MSHKRANRLVLLVIFFCYLLMPFSVSAEEWDMSVDGHAEYRFENNQPRQTPLIFSPTIIGVEESQTVLTPVLAIQAYKEAFSVFGQIRGEHDGEQKDRLELDEFFIEYALNSRHFLSVGRRTIIHGQSLGINPADVFLNRLDVDATKSVNRQRIEIQGQNMLGWEMLVNSQLSLSGYWMPDIKAVSQDRPDRALLAVSYVLPGMNADTNFLIFDDEQPGAGGTFSKSIGQSTLFYVEAIFHQGRKLDALIPEQNGSGSFLIKEGDKSKIFNRTSIGISYIFSSNIVTNFEYYHDDNGYGEREWDDIQSLIYANRDAATNRVSHRNQLSLNKQLRHFTLRRDYGFSRIEVPISKQQNRKVEIAILHNFHDNSGVFNTRLEQEFSETFTAGLYLSDSYGGSLGEFELRSGLPSAHLYLVKTF